MYSVELHSVEDILVIMGLPLGPWMLQGRLRVLLEHLRGPQRGGVATPAPSPRAPLWGPGALLGCLRSALRVPQGAVVATKAPLRAGKVSFGDRVHVSSNIFGVSVPKPTRERRSRAASLGVRIRSNGFLCGFATSSRLGSVVS